MLFLLFPAAVLIAACSNEPDPSSGTAGVETEDPLVLKLYETGDASPRNVDEALGFLLSGIEEARIRALPNGRVAISAPASAHSGIERMIAALAESGDAEPRSIRIHQWLIEGKPADRTTIPERLAPLRDALTELTDAVGPLSLEQLDRTEFVTNENQISNIFGKLLRTNIRAHAAGDALLLDVNVSTPSLGRINTEITVPSGEHVVLAQIQRPLEDEADPDSIIVFVIRADLI
jgi:hypothetical protein